MPIFLSRSWFKRLTAPPTSTSRRPARRFQPQVLALEDRIVPSFTEFLNPHPAVGEFGATVVALSTGNVVVTAPNDSTGGTSAGAVYLFNGATGALMSTLTGSAGDAIGSGGVTALANGNFVVESPNWSTTEGAVTWGSGRTGVSGQVGSANSLVGSTPGDQVGSGGVTALSDGSYAVVSPNWGNGALNKVGAVTVGFAFDGVSGPVGSGNSLVGSTANDQVGSGGVTALKTGALVSFVVSSPLWDNGGVVDAGAVTLVQLIPGPPLLLGALSSGNSLVGSTANAQVGSGGVTALSDGSYVVRSPNWGTGAAAKLGAVTWGSTSGVSGPVASGNSLVGSTANDQVGSGGVTAGRLGNFVVSSPLWDNNLGAVSFGDDTEPLSLSGPVASGNTLVGSTPGDKVGSGGVTVLSQGNFVVSSPLWDNSLGAVTLEKIGFVFAGPLSSSNSLVGEAAGDKVGSGGVTALTNGNFVVSSPNWDSGKGAFTLGDGGIGFAGVNTGTVNLGNSMFGNLTTDNVGSGGVTALSNGNYVVSSPLWHNPDTGADYAGAVTWGSGSTFVPGFVGSGNSLVGTQANDQVGHGGVTALSNGNYVVSSPFWSTLTLAAVGAVTWGNGATGVSGFVTSGNSLYGSTANDEVGSNGVTALTNGNYVVSSGTWINGGIASAGAVTWGSGTTGVSGQVGSANSLVGTQANDDVGIGGVTALSDGNYLVRSPYWANGTTANAGAVTWGSGTTGVSGIISPVNSAIGSVASSDLQAVGSDNVNGTFFGQFVGDGGGRVRVGLQATGFLEDSTPAANSVAEGAAFGTSVGITVTLTDPNGPAVSYTLTDAATSPFTFAPGPPAFATVIVGNGKLLNYETAKSQTITVQAKDGAGGTSTVSFTIAVTNVPPTTPTDADGTANSVPEGAANGTPVGITAFSTDPNGPAVTYSLTANAGGRFAINPSTGVVTVANGTLLNYETATSYTITVQASDGASPTPGTSTASFTIAVANVPPTTPTDADGTANSVPEGAANGTSVGITAFSTDPNGPAVTYSLTDNAGGRFAINPSTGVVTVANGTLLNYETATSYTISVQASDGASPTPGTSTASFTIAVTNVPPTTPTDADGTANSVPEGAANGTPVGITAFSTDPNGPAVTYSLTDNAGGRFAINPSTGVVTVANGTLLNYETARSYTITVQASDGASPTPGTSTASFTIAVTNVPPTTPTDADGTANSVPEGAANGTPVGITAFSTDLNAVTYSLTDNAGGRFAIDPSTGVVTVADGTLLNYETATSYTITVQASDGASPTPGTSTASFTIAVTNVNPTTPTDADGTANSVVEGAANGTLVGITAFSTDPNGPAVSYSLTDNAGGRFAIDPSTGVVTVANGTLLVYATARSYTITVQASDGASPTPGTSTASFTIQVLPAVSVTGAANNRTSIGMFDPATGTWYLNTGASFRYGAPGWIPVVGDWNGDGTTTIGVVDPATMTWYLRNSNVPGAPDVAPFRYGAVGWVPAVGDWDGDGTTTVGVFDPASATWYFAVPGRVLVFAYGAPGWAPVVGDWNGDGTTKVGVFDPATATWHLAIPGGVEAFVYGGPTWQPITGDWNGDGKTSIGVVDPSSAKWYLRNSDSSGGPDLAAFAYGAPGWTPLAGAWTGPGRSLHLVLGGATAAPGVVSLTPQDLSGIVAAGVARAQADGLSPALMKQLSATKFAIGQLGGGVLALAQPGRVVFDATAAGHGWFVDPTPTQDEEFKSAASGALGALPGGPAAGRVDLLTAVLQELAQEAGLTGAAVTDPLAVGARNLAVLDALFAASH